MPVKKPGIIVLLGSGETLPSSGTIHEFAARRLPERPHIVILETPAGFEPNSDLVAKKIKQFLARRLQNYKPRITVLPARRRGTRFSPDSPQIVAPILEADEILLGPGSPTYGARQLNNSLALQMIKARQRLGGVLFLSSSATLAFGRYTMPVYEIYKVGEDLHWQEGLDFFSQYDLTFSVVPHWNNSDGGAELDTSRCYMGKVRFAALMKLLPPEHTILGIDEHTAIIFDFGEGCCYVRGSDSVTILREGTAQVFETGSTLPMDVLGNWRIPRGRKGVSAAVWEKAEDTAAKIEAARETIPEPPVEVHALLQARTEARANEDWGEADRLREQILAAGWQVMDTDSGSKLAPLSDN